MAQLDTHPCSKLTMPREENNYQFHVLSVIPINNRLVRRCLPVCQPYKSAYMSHMHHLCTIQKRSDNYVFNT